MQLLCHPTCSYVVDDTIAVPITNIHQLLAGRRQAAPVAAPPACLPGTAAASTPCKPSRSSPVEAAACTTLCLHARSTSISCCVQLAAALCRQTTAAAGEVGAGPALGALERRRTVRNRRGRLAVTCALHTGWEHQPALLAAEAALS